MKKSILAIILFLISMGICYAGMNIVSGNNNISIGANGALSIGANSIFAVEPSLNVDVTANFGSMAYQGSNNVSITGGNIDVTTANVDGTLTVSGVAGIVFGNATAVNATRENLGLNVDDTVVFAGANLTNLTVSGVANVTGATWTGLNATNLGNSATANVASSANALATNVTIVTNNLTTTGGSIDGTTIGANTPAAGYFTTLNSTDVTTLYNGMFYFGDISGIGGNTGPAIKITAPTGNEDVELALTQNIDGVRTYGMYHLIDKTTSDYHMVNRKNLVDTTFLTVQNQTGRIGWGTNAPGLVNGVNMTSVRQQETGVGTGYYHVLEDASGFIGLIFNMLNKTANNRLWGLYTDNADGSLNIGTWQDNGTASNSIVFTRDGNTQINGTFKADHIAEKTTSHGVIVDNDMSVPNFTVRELATMQSVNWGKATDVASASTTDIGAANGVVVDITGSNTITGFGNVAAGTTRLVRFTGASTLTHNATSLILPGASNILTANGDRATLISLGSGNWYVQEYLKASGIAVGRIAEEIVASNATITRAQAFGGVINNYGQNADLLFTLLPIEAKMNFVVALGTTVAKFFKIHPNTGDVIILDGTALAASTNVVITSAVAGAQIQCYSITTGANAYTWICNTISGAWTSL